MILQLEHINGISNDNRLFNLCFLCPNCHSQTTTFCGKQFKKDKIKLENTKNENKFLYKRKILNRPSKEELYTLVWSKPTSKIAKDFGVSDTAIAKWCKEYNIEKPKRGYWAKIKYLAEI